MPYIVQGNPSPGKLTDSSANFNYSYPGGIDLKPGSNLHQKLVSEILLRAQDARTVMSKRFDSWREIDRTLTVYKRPDEDEKEIQGKDSRKPVSIVFPYSYAIREIVLAYLTAIFLQDPIFRYDGRSPEDSVGAILLEKTISQQCDRSKVGLNLHTQLGDSLSYGMGIVTPWWDVVKGKKYVRSEEQVMVAGVPTTTSSKKSVETVIFEGNRLDNISPYCYLPDPNVACHDIQRGEFVGWVANSNYINLLKEESQDDSIFNVKYVKLCQNMRSIYGKDESDRQKKYGGASETNFQSTTKVDIIKMYINLVPKDWGLSPRETPEKWLFFLVNDTVIIKAQPINLTHDKYPVAVAAPDYDGYSQTPMSRLEILFGLQHTLDWLFNSHIANVRKAINDMIVYDPYLINGNDLKTPEPGKLIRTRRPAWGRGVKDSVQQLTINDITRGNISDSAFIVQWMQLIGGADSSMGGMLRQGGPERLSAAEFGGTKAGQAGRLERVSKVISMQSMQDIGYMFASHVQQLMDQETYVRTVGRWPEDIMKTYGVENGMAKVSPMDLLIDYDVVNKDASLPTGENAKLWLDALQIIGQSPQLMQTFDTVRIFTQFALLAGAKNTEDFKLKVQQMQPQVLPDQQVDQQVQAGNLVPIGG